MPRVTYDTSFDQNGQQWFTVVRNRLKGNKQVSKDSEVKVSNSKNRNILNPYDHVEYMSETYRVECCKKLGIHPHLSTHLELDPHGIDFQSPYMHQDWNPVIHAQTRDDDGRTIRMNPRAALRRRNIKKKLAIERNAEEGLLKLESSGLKLGKLIEKHRNRLGMCQEELAQELSIPQRVVSELEKGTALLENSRGVIKGMNNVFTVNLFSELKAESNLN